jgi:hypothetical protein
VPTIEIRTNDDASFGGRFLIPTAEMAGNSDLPSIRGSIVKLNNFLLWIKGEGNETTKAYSGRDHQQVARITIIRYGFLFSSPP